MPRIQNDREIRDAADPVDIIGRRVSLKNNGGDHIGRCPFHKAGNERSPSLHVKPDRGWYCHGPCKRGGTVIDFIMEYEGLEYVEAIELLASETGQRIQYDTSGSSTTTSSSGASRQDLYAAVLAAAQHYVATLADNQAAREYADSRGLTEDVRKAWQIGYAKGNSVREVADPEILEAAGVLKRSKTSDDLYDPLAGRLIIPLGDTTGRPIAFTGRALPGNTSAAKYLNTADTRIYKKGEHLFAYHRTVQIIRGQDNPPAPLVVEGQLNAIACHRQGTPAVAPGGSTLTERQALLLQRLHETTRLGYDQDPAGRNATHKAITTCRGIGQTVYIAALDDDRDPDEIVTAGENLTYHPAEIVPWALEHLVSADPGTGEWAHQVSNTVIPLIHAHTDPVVREYDEQQLAEHTGLSRDAISARLKNLTDKTEADAHSRQPAETTAQIDTALTPERALCAIALQMSFRDAESNPWHMYLRPLDLPKSLLSVLSDIGRVRRYAHERGLAVSTAVRILRNTLSYVPYLEHWTTTDLPAPADLTGFGRVQDHIADAEDNRRRQQGEL